MVKGEESFTAIRARVDSNGRKRKERGKGKGKGGKSIFLFLDIGETRGGCTRPVGRREERQGPAAPFFPSIVFPGGAKKRGGWEEGGCQPGHKLRPPDPCVSLGGGKGKGADGQGITGNRGG